MSTRVPDFSPDSYAAAADFAPAACKSARIAGLASCILTLLAGLPLTALAADVSQAEILERLERLEQQQQETLQLLQSRDERIRELEAQLGLQQADQADAADALVAAEAAAEASADLAVEESLADTAVLVPDATESSAVTGSSAGSESAAVASTEKPVSDAAEASVVADGSAKSASSAVAASEKPAAAASAAAPDTVTVASTEKPVADPANDMWGFYDPGKGFMVGKSDVGELSISAYALVRYLNQDDEDGEFTDHLGNVRPVDGRQDIYAHRALVWLNGWVGVPKLRYTIAWWTVNATDSDALFGNIGYQFSRKFNLYAGIYGNPGSRSMQGSHPYWLGTDRVMADEFFRPFFSQGIFANGEVAPGLWYNASVGNSSSTLGNTALDLDRDFTYGGSVWWMPTTHEFGPRGGYGDWEWHEEVATRFGFSTVYSPEQRYNAEDTQPGDTAPSSSNTAIKLADSLNAFNTGALAPGVTVSNLDYQIFSVDAGMKYKGVFLQTEYYYRVLDNFEANGLLPVTQLKDQGFYVQGSFYPWPKKIELYAATSQIYGDKDAGFSRSYEYILGTNYYIANSRNYRLNFQVIDVHASPVSSTFGYYVGGETGYIWSAAASIFF